METWKTKLRSGKRKILSLKKRKRLWKKYGLQSVLRDLEVHCSQWKLVAALLSQLHLAKLIGFLVPWSALDRLHSDTRGCSQSHHAGICGWSHAPKSFLVANNELYFIYSFIVKPNPRQKKYLRMVSQGHRRKHKKTWCRGGGESGQKAFGDLCVCNLLKAFARLLPTPVTVYAVKKQQQKKQQKREQSPCHPLPCRPRRKENQAEVRRPRGGLFLWPSAAVMTAATLLPPLLP